MIKYAPAPTQRQQAVPSTSEDISAKRRMALSLMQEGTSAAPVQHWTQALARVVQAGVGGMNASQASSEGKARESYDTQQSAAQRIAAGEQEFQNKKRWDEYQRGRELTEAEKLDMEYKRAQAEKLRRDAADAGTTYGKSGSIFQGPDNKFYSIQFGGDGSRVILPLEVPGQGGQPGVAGPSQPQAPAPQEGAGRFAAPGMSTAQQPPMPLTPSRGVDVVGSQMYDKATGSPVRNVGPNLAEAEKQKAIGDAAGKATASAPSDIMGADTALELVNSLRNDPNRQMGTGLSSVFNVIPGTPGYDFSTKVDQAKGGAFLTAIQQLRGMGALSNAEGQTATTAVTRMQTATSEGEFMAALDDYEKIVRRGRTMAMQRLGLPDDTPAGAPQVRTYNPQTGRLE